MGLDDIARDVEEEVKALDDDEIEDFIERFDTISQTVITMDSDMTDMEDQLDAIERLVKVLIDEYKRLDDTTQHGEVDGFLDDEDDESDDSNAWEK